jgi:pilus assembly protein Flp/PilA
MVRPGFAAEIQRFAADDSGATAIEYAMIASGVSIAIVSVVSTLGTSLKETLYDKVGSIFD